MRGRLTESAHLLVGQWFKEEEEQNIINLWTVLMEKDDKLLGFFFVKTKAELVEAKGKKLHVYHMWEQRRMMCQQSGGQAALMLMNH